MCSGPGYGDLPQTHRDCFPHFRIANSQHRRYINAHICTQFSGQSATQWMESAQKACSIWKSCIVPVEGVFGSVPFSFSQLWPPIVVQSVPQPYNIYSIDIKLKRAVLHLQNELKDSLGSPRNPSRATSPTRKSCAVVVVVLEILAIPPSSCNQIVLENFPR